MEKSVSIAKGVLGKKLSAELIASAIRGDVESAEALLGKGASAAEVDEVGYTALMWAARYDLAPMVQLLLPWSDLDYRAPGPEGKTALEVAKQGAGSKTLSAAYIESYQLALSELAALRELSGYAPKRGSKPFRL